MRMTSTGAFPRALAAARPPKPPPTITTRGVFDLCSSAPLIELRLELFIHSFLKLSSPEISESSGLFSRAARQWPNHFDDRRPRSLSEPELDQQNQDKRGDTEPGDHDDFDPHFANGRNIVIDVRVAVEESVAIAKDVCPSRQVNEEEEGRGDSQSRESCGIN